MRSGSPRPMFRSFSARCLTCGAVLAWHAHHLGDHQHRQGRGEVAHDVHAPFVFRLVEEVFDGGLDEGAPRLHGLGREIAMHDLAHLEMLGAVVLDELIGLVLPDVLVQAQIRLIDVRVGRPGIVLEDGGREQLVVSSEPDDVS